MRVASIHTYPVKAGHRLDHDRAQVQPWGLAGDRRWMVVDPNGRQITQRDDGRLALVHPAPRPGGGLTLRTPGMPDLDVPEPTERELVGVTVWRSALAGSRAGGAADAWFTELLDREARLVWLDDPTRRATDPKYSEPADRVSFADAYPLLLTNAASLDAINGWLLESGSLEGPLPMTRFRPSVVVSGADAWAEDGWLGRRIRIGGVVLRAVKPCGRCVVTTTDQETGERGHEPLPALTAHRNVDQKLLFGIYLIPDGTGSIALGDPVEVQ